MSKKDRKAAAETVEPERAMKETHADRAMQQARVESERAHLDYVATLDPRERVNLAPWAV